MADDLSGRLLAHSRSKFTGDLTNELCAEASAELDRRATQIVRLERRIADLEEESSRRLRKAGRLMEFLDYLAETQCSPHNELDRFGAKDQWGFITWSYDADFEPVPEKFAELAKRWRKT